MSENVRLRRLRRAYARQGSLIRKVPERSRWFNQYGPYMVVDARTGAVEAHGCDLDSLAEQATAV